MRPQRFCQRLTLRPLRLALVKVVADCYLVAVEKREPMRCGVWKLTDGILESCALENERAIAALRKCRREGNWPTGTEDLRLLDV